MTIIYLIRHCEIKSPKKIAAFRLPGFPLSAEGKGEAKSIAKYFKNKSISVIYSSPILRAKQTAKIIASVLDLDISVSPLLNETRSPLQGMSLEEFFKMKKEIFFEEKHIKGGGETIEEINTRMKKFIGRTLKKHRDREVIVVSHGDPIMIYADTLIRGKAGRLLPKRRNYIQKGGIFKLVFDEEGKLASHARVNY